MVKGRGNVNIDMVRTTSRGTRRGKHINARAGRPHLWRP